MGVLFGLLLLGVSVMCWFALIVGMFDPSIFKRQIFGGGQRGNIAARSALAAIATGIIGTLSISASVMSGGEPFVTSTIRPLGSRPASAPASAQKAPDSTDWKVAMFLSGNSSKRSPLFDLIGQEARMIYRVEGDVWSIFSVTVMEAGTSTYRDGAIPDIMTTGPCPGEMSYLYVGPGRYYLDVTAANAAWSVVIQDRR